MIGKNLILACVRDNDSDTLLSLEAKYLSQPEEEMLKFCGEYFVAHAELPKISTMEGKFPGNKIPEEPVSYWRAEFSKLRLSLIFEKGSSNVLDLISTGDLSAALSAIAQLNAQSQEENLKIFSASRTEAMSDIVETIAERRQLSGLIGVTSGWDGLDRLTNGFIKKNVYVLAARQKMGKTMALAYMAEAAYRAGNKVLVVSMEMGKEEYFTRVLSLAARISSHSLFKGNVSSMAEQYLRELTRVPDDRRYIFQEGFLKTSVADLQGVITRGGYDIVFIDGAYLLKVPGAQKMPLWEKATEIISQLKIIAGRQDVPVVTTYQFNREAAKKHTAGTEHIHQSDAIGQIATTVMGMFDIPDEVDTKKIEVIANRNGPCGWVKIHWDWRNVNFSQIDSYDEAEVTEQAASTAELTRDGGEYETIQEAGGAVRNNPDS